MKSLRWTIAFFAAYLSVAPLFAYTAPSIGYSAPWAIEVDTAQAPGPYTVSGATLNITWVTATTANFSIFMPGITPGSTEGVINIAIGLQKWNGSNWDNVDSVSWDGINYWNNGSPCPSQSKIFSNYPVSANTNYRLVGYVDRDNFGGSDQGPECYPTIGGSANSGGMPFVAPTPSITSDKTSITVGQAVTFTVSATDTDGSMTGMNMDYDGGGYFQVDAGPYSFNGSSTPNNGNMSFAPTTSKSQNCTVTFTQAGTYSFKASVYDPALSNWYYSGLRTITVNPSSTAMTNPTSSNATINVGDTWEPSISAPGSNGGGATAYCIASVTNWKISGNKFTASTAGTYSFYVGQFSPGASYTANGTYPDAPRAGDAFQINYSAYTLTVLPPALTAPDLSTYSWYDDDSSSWPTLYTPSSLNGSQSMRAKDGTGTQYYGWNYGVNSSKLTSSPSPGSYTFTLYIFDNSSASIVASRNVSVSVSHKPAGTPSSASLSPLSKTVNWGDSINFAISGSCSTGLGNMYLYICSAGGTPTSLVGSTTASGTSDTKYINWTAPNATGTVYLRGLVYDVTNSNYLYTSVATITVINPTYSITVTTDGTSGCTASGSASGLSSSANPSISATPDATHDFDYWEKVSGNGSIGNATLASTNFNMSGSNVIVKAHFKNKTLLPSGSFDKPLYEWIVQVPDVKVNGVKGSITLTEGDTYTGSWNITGGPAKQWLLLTDAGNFGSFNTPATPDSGSMSITIPTNFLATHPSTPYTSFSMGSFTDSGVFEGVTLNWSVSNAAGGFEIRRPDNSVIANSGTSKMIPYGGCPIPGGSSEVWTMYARASVTDAWTAVATAVFHNNWTYAGDQVMISVVAKTYTLTVTNDGNGTASASQTSGSLNQTANLTAVPNTGYSFDYWELVAGSGGSLSGSTYTFGSANATVKAHFKMKPTGTVSVTPLAIMRGVDPLSVNISGTATSSSAMTISATCNGTAITGILASGTNNITFSRMGYALPGDGSYTFKVFADDGSGAVQIGSNQTVTVTKAPAGTYQATAVPQSGYGVWFTPSSTSSKTINIAP